MSHTHRPYVRLKPPRHISLRVEGDVKFADAKARSQKVLLEETHVVVGDHAPEPRATNTVERIIADCNADKAAHQRRIDARPFTRDEMAELDRQIMALEPREHVPQFAQFKL